MQVPEDEVITFNLSSDDGSKLWLNNKLIIDNDGLHGMTEKSGTVALAAGYHQLRLAYFQKSGGNDLKLSWNKGKNAKEPIPDGVLFYGPPK